MKRRAAAALAVVLIPLLLLGGGVWVAAARTRSMLRADSPSGRKASAKIAAFLSESKDSSRAVHTIPVQIALSGVPIDRVNCRSQIIASLERLWQVERRAGECKELWPEASTEEEGRALQREKVVLDKDIAHLRKELDALAATDPASIVDLVKNGGDIPYRLRLAGLIAPEIDAEISSEDAPSGPLLSGLLTQASGDAGERAHLAAFAGQLLRANRDLGRVLLNLMNDPDPVVRMNAASSVCELARVGRLKEFLAEQSDQLRNLSMLALAPSDSRTRGSALRTLAALGSDAADDFVLQRFEELQLRSDAVDSYQALQMVARRMAGRNEARLFTAIQRALDLPFERDIHYGLRGVAFSLSPERRAEFMRLLELKTPDSADGPIHTGFVVRRGGRGRGMTWVSGIHYDLPR
jgi:hypothetical protein